MGYFDRLRGRDTPPDEPAEAPPEERPIAPAWDRLPGEPEGAYEDFCRWIDQDASVDAWAASTGRSLSGTRAKAARGRWGARRAAYRAHLRRCALAAAEDEAGEIGREHARALRALRELATAAILDRLASGKSVNLKDATAALKLAIDGERMIAGQATDKIDLGAVPKAVIAAMDADIHGDG